MNMRRIVEQSRVKRDATPRQYPAAREFPVDGVAPSASESIRCKRYERESAFTAQANANAAWLASHSASHSASPSIGNAIARAEKQRIARARAIEDREKLANAKALIATPRATWSEADREREQARRDTLQAERAAWSGVDA